MMLTGQTQRTRRETYACAKLSTSNPTWASLKSNTDLRGDRPATDRLSHGTPRNCCVKSCPNLYANKAGNVLIR